MDIASEVAHTARMPRPAPLLVAAGHRELPELDFPDNPADRKGTGTHSSAGSNHFVVADTADMVGTAADMVDRAGMAVDMLVSGSTMFVTSREQS